MGAGEIFGDEAHSGKLEDLLKSFAALIRSPEDFLRCGVKAESSKFFTKTLFDLTMELEKNPKNPVELITQDFDDEQIWQQLELSNLKIQNVVPTIVDLITSEEVAFPVSFEEISNEEEDPESSEACERLVLELDEDVFGGSDDQDEILEEDNSDDFLEDKEKDVREDGSFQGVDDEFFKLSDMEKFLDNEDQKSENLRDGFDYFEDPQSESEHENAMYKDFFKSERVAEEAEEVAGNRKRVKFALQDVSTENTSDEEEDSVDLLPKSSFKVRQDRLQKKIEELEESGLEPKPWQLAGEVTASSRPVNSLLEEFVEFDTAQRPAPVITEQTALQLEDIIKKLIKDKAFDDVERKIKPISTPHEYKNKLVLDQEKSKHSLAEVYEKEYLKQKESVSQEKSPAEEPQEHQDVRSRMTALFTQLDALSNYFFTPKLKLPQLRVVHNTPAISLEEVGPEASADCRLLAPEELVGEVKKSLLGKDERTKTDKKREKRKKRQHQAARFKSKGESDQLAKTELGEIKNLRHRRQISKLGNETGVVKSSKEFFSRLQDSTETGWKRKKTPRNLKEAKKLKL